MPNVLLFGGSDDLLKIFDSDTRWKVLRAVHGDRVTPRLLGDPLDWNLVVDDCGHADEVPSSHYGGEEPPEGYAVVSESYLVEASNTRGITICATSHNDHFRARTGAPDGYHDLEFNQTNSAAAQHLVDFVDEFEHEFFRGCLRSSFHAFTPTEEILFKDKYEGSVIQIRSDVGLQILQTVDIPDEAARLRAYEYLCYRTAPKLWPEIYSAHFRPSRVASLEGERERITGELRTRIAELDSAIDAELVFYAQYAVLTELADDALKELVHKALLEVFGLQVTDLDKELEEGEPKTLDLLISNSEEQGFIEVKSSGNRGAQVRWLERLDDHVERVTERHGPPTFKVFVFNGLYRREAAQRTEAQLFNQPAIEEATDRGITMLSTATLLKAIEEFRNGNLDTDDFVAALRVPGLFHPPWNT